MWSLPNIKELNNQAVKDWKKESKKKNRTKGHTCEHCEEKATVVYDWYDIFSDTPKGQIYLCETHDGYYGSPDEGYFYCEGCDKHYINNYTWENYYYADEDGTLCLNCYFDKELKNEENWISSPDDVNWDRVRGAKHLIPVSGHYWESKLVFIGNVEFDSLEGKKLAGFDSTSTREDGLEDLRNFVKSALEKSDRCILIMDACYQFACSIAIYIEKK